jgi:hypothetical protein
MKDRDTSTRKKLIMSSSLVGVIIAVWCCQIIARPAASRTMPSSQANYTHATKTLASQIKAQNLDSKVLELALKAYNNAKHAGYGENEHLTIVDYSLPSSTPRMWVIDMHNKTVTHHTYVAHGIGSGEKYAYKFSNQPGSGKSSLGLYLTGDIYKGRYGQSLNLQGLDGKFNSNALSRRIVVHKAHYVDENVIRKIGRLGRSLGCLALNKKVADKIMHTIKGGSLIFCYYPDKTWLSESKMLHT